MSKKQTNKQPLTESQENGGDSSQIIANIRTRDENKTTLHEYINWREPRVFEKSTEAKIWVIQRNLKEYKKYILKCNPTSGIMQVAFHQTDPTLLMQCECECQNFRQI